MKIRIENGMTIISTGDAVGGKKNKTSGFQGVAYNPYHGMYRAEIYYKKQRYTLGMFEKVEDAVAIREQAKEHIKQGTFLDWQVAVPIKRKSSTHKGEINREL